MVERANLTEERIRALAPPAAGETVVWDSKITGFGVRCFPSGRKVYILMYRPAGGRRAPKRRMTLGDVEGVKLVSARAAAQNYLGQIAAGADPQADRKAVARREASRLDHAIENYRQHLVRRKVVNGEQIIRNLKRYMPGPLDEVDLMSLDRQTMAARIARIETQIVVATEARTTSKLAEAPSEKISTVRRKVGGVGAAADFRTKAHTFFNWAVSRGLMFANPLAGWRRERTTRAEMTGRTGRALSDAEIRDVWNAAGTVPAPYGDFVKLLLLTGQRRTETARMRWQDLDWARAEWTIPASVAKNGKQHTVPLPRAALDIIERQARFTNPFVFSGRNTGSAISNWSKRQSKLTAAAHVEFTLHDLRRTFRSGLRRVGIDTELAEMMLNHSRAELIEVYDREPRMAERAAAADLWANYIGDLTKPPSATNVVRLQPATAA